MVIEEHIGCASCLKTRNSLLDGLSYNELCTLDKNRSLVHYNKGETIYKTGLKPYGLICLSSGKVKITKTGCNGKEQIVDLKKPVDFLGLRSLLNSKVYDDTATAIEDSEVCIIEKEDFFDVLKGNNAMALRIIGDLSDQLGKLSSRVVNLTQKYLEGRLAEALILIHDVYGTMGSNNLVINVQLKRADLASLSNMTTANVIRTLSAFVKDKVISVNRRQITILDLRRLQEMSRYKSV